MINNPRTKERRTKKENETITFEEKREKRWLQSRKSKDLDFIIITKKVNY